MNWNKLFSEGTFIRGDCMEYMRQMPDNVADLAIIDPPYGIGASEMTMGSGKNKKYNKGKKWDTETPSKEYFHELNRISKNQIIFGGNYFELPISRGWIFWDKGINGDCSFADGELLWTSFDQVLRKADVRYKGFLGADSNRIHICQKPIRLFKWLLRNYAKPTDKIISTHVGSGSDIIAFIDFGCDYVGFEIDAEYYAAATQRINNHKAQLKLF